MTEYSGDQVLNQVLDDAANRLRTEGAASVSEYRALTAGLTDLVVLTGISVRNTHAVNIAIVQIRDGAVGGAIVAVVRAGADNVAAPVVFPDVEVVGGVYIEIVSGTVTGAVFGRTS